MTVVIILALCTVFFGGVLVGFLFCDLINKNAPQETKQTDKRTIQLEREVIALRELLYGDEQNATE